MSLRSSIAHALANVIDNHDMGQQVGVLKYAGHDAANVALQGNPTFDSPVNIVGIVGYDPTEDELAQVGAGQDGDVKGMVTFTRLHLEEKFPGVLVDEIVKRPDRLVIAGFQWRVITAHPTGHFNGVAEVVVVTFTEPVAGKATYP